MLFQYFIILLKLIVVFAYLSYMLLKHILKHNFFSSCERFLWLSEQILKLYDLENFDFTRRIRIEHKLSRLEFDNYQRAIEYIEEVSRELQMPNEYNRIAHDMRFQLYNERLEQMRCRATVLLAAVRNAVEKDN